MKSWFAAAALAVFSVGHVSAADVPNVVEFSTPTAGVTGIVMGDGQKYDLYLDVESVVGGIPESNPTPPTSRSMAANVATTSSD